MAQQLRPIPQSQSTVLRLVVVGITLLAIIFLSGWYLLPVQPGKFTSLPEKFAFTLRWQVLSSSVLIFGVNRVGNARYNSAAIDPTHAGSEEIIGVRARFLQNTLEQLVISLFGQLVLTTYLEDNLQRVIPTLVVIFVVARILFYVGYMTHPLYRATGFSMTFIPTVAVHVYCFYCLIVYGPTYGLK